MRINGLACIGFTGILLSVALTLSGFFDGESMDTAQSSAVASDGVPWTYADGERVDAQVTNALWSSPRSGRWRALRNEMVREHPRCFVCGAPTTVIHHLRPFGVDHDGELNRMNLIWYCDRCHLFVGHLCCFRAWNTNCRNDSVEMKWKIVNRSDIAPTTNRIEAVR